VTDSNTENPLLPTTYRPGGPAPVAKGQVQHVGHFPLARAPKGIQITPLVVVRSLRRQWFQAACVSILAASVATGGAWFIFQTRANVRSLLRVATTPPKVMFATAENAAVSREEFTNYLKTQEALVKSRPVLNAALNDPKLSALSILQECGDQRDWLEKEIKVDNQVAPEILRISMDGDRPEERALIVTAVTNAYLTEIVNKEKNRRLKRLQQVKDLQGRTKEDVRRKRERLRDYAETFGSGDKDSLALTHKFALEQLDMAKKEWIRCRQELLRLKVELETKGSGTNKAGGPPVPPEMVEPQPDDNTLSDDLKLMARLEDTIGKAAENSPMLRNAKRELEALKKRVQQHRTERATVVSKQFAAKNRFDRAMTAEARVDEYKGMERLEELYRKELEKLTEECQKISRSQFEIQAIKDEIEETDKLAKQFANEEQKLEVEIQAPERIEPLEDAVISLANAEKRRHMAMAMGGVGALALSLFAFVFFDLRGRRIVSHEDVDQFLGVRIVGSVPFIASNGRQNGDLASGKLIAERHFFAESIDAVRTTLLQEARQNSLQILMITSAVGGEGKTSMACHLATSLAKAGRRTLLMDWDLRKPSLHRIFKTPLSPGVGELLAGSAILSDLIRPTMMDGLALIAAGEADDAAMKALARGQAKLIFDEVRPQFDVIIVDSCPVLPVADALMIGQEVDAVVFSIFREVSRMPLVREAWNRLQALGIRVLGAIVTGTQERHYGGYYDKYYSGKK
jgi:capsular exopolysaccharide synthesis family protein